MSSVSYHRVVGLAIAIAIAIAMEKCCVFYVTRQLSLCLHCVVEADCHISMYEGLFLHTLAYKLNFTSEPVCASNYR